MEKDDWGSPDRILGIQENYEWGRAIEIYQAIKDLEISNIVDVACGYGLVLDSLKWIKPNMAMYQFDINAYPEWKHLSVESEVKDVMDFVKEDKKYDLVLFLNSYRNWDDESRRKFDKWLNNNAKYFITSGNSREGGEIIGNDGRGFPLKLYEIQG